MGRMTSHILWKIKNVPNHQPVLVIPHIAVPLWAGLGEGNLVAIEHPSGTPHNAARVRNVEGGMYL